MNSVNTNYYGSMPLPVAKAPVRSASEDWRALINDKRQQWSGPKAAGEQEKSPSVEYGGKVVPKNTGSTQDLLSRKMGEGVTKTLHQASEWLTYGFNSKTQTLPVQNKSLGNYVDYVA